MSDIREQLDSFFVENFQQFEEQLNGESALPVHSKRKSAIDAFKAAGFPAAKNEEYKYTDVAKAFKKLINFEDLSDGTIALSIDEAAKYFIPEMDAIRLVFVNGDFNAGLSDIQDLPEGLTIMPLKDAYTKEDESFNKHFASYKNEGLDSFSELNTAFAEGGVFIKIARNKVIKKPIACYFFNDCKNGVVISQPRNLIVAEQNSQSTVLESFVTLGEHASFTNTVSEIVVEQDAHCQYYKLQEESEKAIHVGGTEVNQIGKCVFTAATFTFSGGLMRNNLNIAMHQEHSEANMYGLYLIDGKSHVDNHTVVDHLKPNCESNELYKGIIDGKANAVFNGKIFVREDAQKTNAFQSNRNVLLSDDAEVNTKPQLEIWADDVQCSHGCTVGQLDEDQLFYLRARGLDEKSAKALLLNAFASDVLTQVKNDAFRSYIEHKIAERLQNN